ncbi:MAG TPA: ABC transporter ATP-binding protein [Methylocella sp.]|nr:ABC transporter ATP-binding protein [Methylocella sp.]
MSFSTPEREAAICPASQLPLEIACVGYSYGRRMALETVSFTVAPRSFTVLLGPNGAGKSTLYCLITRLYATQQGTIQIFGYDVNRSSVEALRRLGVVFQPRTLDLDLTVMQNLSYHAALHGISERQAKLRAHLVLEQIALTARKHDKVRSLSGGQMRRVEIARGLLHEPQLLLLDEPTVGLDIKARADILTHVRSLAMQEGIGVLWATHLIDEVEAHDDVVVLHQGRVLDRGKASNIADRAGATDIRMAFEKLTAESVVSGQ